MSSFWSGLAMFLMAGYVQNGGDGATVFGLVYMGLNLMLDSQKEEP